MKIRSAAVTGLLVGCGVFLGGCAAHKPQAGLGAPAERAARYTPEQALNELMAGNERFATGRGQRPNQSLDRMSEVAGGQLPFAVVLACSDSRVPVEVIFDQGLGDVFVVRLAGNIASDAAIGSMEYAVQHLGSTVVMVLGHSSCGAVEATLQTIESGQTPPGHLPALVDAIRPAVARDEGNLAAAIDANVVYIVEKLRRTGPVLSQALADGRLKIVGGVYDLGTGRVVLLSGR